MNFESVNDYLDAFSKDTKIAALPVKAAADFLELKPQTILQKLKTGELTAITIARENSKWRGVSIQSLLEIQKQYNKNKQTIFNTLKTCARRKQSFITYSSLMQKIGLRSDKPQDRRMIGKMLGDISITTFEDNGFLLSALVVKQRPGWEENGLPSDAFFNLAEEIDKNYSIFEDDWAYLDEQLQKIKNHYTK